MVRGFACLLTPVRAQNNTSLEVLALDRNQISWKGSKHINDILAVKWLLLILVRTTDETIKLLLSVRLARFGCCDLAATASELEEPNNWSKA